MSACRPKGICVTADPQYINRKYVQEVGVISTHDARHSLQHNHVTLNESQLIENAKLTSSEREVNKLRLSGNFDVNDDVFDAEFKSQELGENVPADGSKEQDEDCISAVEEDGDDAAMFYETQTDESTLIKYAKLTDDALDEAVKCSGKLIHDIVCANEQELNVPLKMSDENADGFKTPVNSEDGDKTTAVIKKKLATCFNVSHEINTKEDKRAVALYKQSPGLTEVVADTAEQRVVRRNIYVGEITDADDEPRDADFCKLVDDVVYHLQDCDLDEMLSMFAGSGILEMTGLVPPADLMEILQRHRLISRDNLFHLQGLIIRLDDADLYTKAVQYTRHHHDIVYFYQDKDITTKGFGKVRCFVGGHDFTRITREDIELVRFKVASLVFMPAHYVYIVGIEPGQRVVITLMLLDRYVQELSEMAREGLAELSLVKVDAVQIYGKTYSTTGTTAIEKYREGGHVSFLSVYQQLRDKSKRLEERDAEVRKLREDAELKQLELETMGAELELLTEKALHESVVRKRFQRQPFNRHSRTRSFPLSYREDSDDKNFAQALESAVITNTVEQVPELHGHDQSDHLGLPERAELIRLSHNMNFKVKNTIKMTRSSYSHEPVINKGAVTVIPCVDMSEYTLFHETNELMKDIEAILGELALGSGK